MKFLFRSGWGESLGLARRVEAEGNSVRFSVVEKKAQRIGLGLINKTNDWPGVTTWADVVVFDSNYFEMPREAERLRGDKKAVLGASELSGRLEHDRLSAASLARKVGLNTGEFHRFKGNAAFRLAAEFLSNEEGAWVWKPNGANDIASTYVSDNIEEMFRMLSYFETLYRRAGEKPDFVLCRKVDGIEISTEGWFNGEEWFLPNHTIEKNRFFPGDLGEKTGCAGNVVWGGETKLFNELISPLTNELKGKYNGPIDVNALIEEETNKPIFLEFTPRFGYDAIFALCELVDDFGKLIYEMASGKRWSGRASEGFAGGLRIHTPPYPEEEEHRGEDIPIFGWDVDNRSVWPCEVMLDESGEPVTSGPNGYVFVLTNKGANPMEVMKGCEPKKLKIPLMRYREDLPDALQTCYNELLETEWIGPKPRRLFGR